MGSSPRAGGTSSPRTRRWSASIRRQAWSIHGQVMHSPGPMLYWLLALPARFGSVTSIAVTMGVVNTLAIIGCVALARRRGGLILMFATAIGIALMAQSLPTEAMHDMWNPAAGLFPFLLLVFLCWSLACGEYRLLPLTVLRGELHHADPSDVCGADGGVARRRLRGCSIRSLERRRRRPADGRPRRGCRACGRGRSRRSCWRPPAGRSPRSIRSRTALAT